MEDSKKAIPPALRKGCDTSGWQNVGCGARVVKVDGILEGFAGTVASAVIAVPVMGADGCMLASRATQGKKTLAIAVIMPLAWR